MKARVKQDLWDGDGSDTPRRIVVNRGDIVDVVKDGVFWAYMIKINNDIGIGCTADEIELLGE